MQDRYSGDPQQQDLPFSELRIVDNSVILTQINSPEPPPIEPVVPTLINEITLTRDDICLILDDYHLIESQPIHTAVTFLRDHLQEHIHLVISSLAYLVDMAKVEALDTMGENRKVVKLLGRHVWY